MTRIIEITREFQQVTIQLKWISCPYRIRARDIYTHSDRETKQHDAFLIVSIMDFFVVVV